MKFRNSHVCAIIFIISYLLFISGCADAPPQVKKTHPFPLKVERGSSGNSFWRDQVQYPFAVKYAKAKDGKGMEWEVAYMDEYYGTEPDPEILVLIHCKGGFGGYFGHIMKVALENGFRVIVPDLPHYGKSIPGNLNKPLSRSLQDTREVMHKIIVDQLGVKKAAYLGHSLGGQWVLGYALTYPDVVKKIILESSAGLEEYPTKIKVGDKSILMFDDSQKDLKNWKIVWGALLQQALKQDEEYWKNFAYCKQKNLKTGKIEPAKTGFFINDTEYAGYFTAVRIASIQANQKEYYNFCAMDTRDVYSLGVEVRRDDHLSINKRIGGIKVPILLAFGDKDSFLPTPLSGKCSLKWDIIKPVYDNLKKAGNPPLVKLYAGAGHFIHIDLPDMFSRDVVSFVKESKVEGGQENVDGYKIPIIKSPDDVLPFFDQYRKDILSHDIKRISVHYASNFKQDGYERDAYLRLLNNNIKFVNNYVVKLTRFEPDRINPHIVHIGGAVDLGPVTVPFVDDSMIIKENGIWKWYGNQK